MLTSRLPLLTALALAGGLTACGNKDNAAEQTTAATEQTPATVPTAGSGAPTPVPAAGVAATTPAATPDATFDLSTVPVSAVNMGSFPYFSKLPGYHLNVPSDSTDYEFDRLYVYDGKQMLPVEGHVLRREYIPVNEQKETSELMMARNYENLVKSLGGVKVWSGEIPSEAVDKLGDDYRKYRGLDAGKSTDTYLIQQKDKEVWVQLLPNHYRYTLNVVERAAMPQKLTVTPAAELKKKLATEGHVALYLNFDTDKTTLRPEAGPMLAEVRTLLTQSPDLRLAVEGHTDNVGTPAHNQQLSAGRARAVVAALLAQGIAPARLSDDGFGATRPLADNATEAGRAQNRRVELVRQ